MKEYFVISTTTDLLRIASESVIFISSDGNYSSLMLTNGESRLLTMQLGQIEKLISQQLPQTSLNFIRIGKSLIINRTYIYYINIPKQQLVLADGDIAQHSLSASREALKQLKELIEKGQK